MPFEWFTKQPSRMCKACEVLRSKGIAVRCIRKKGAGECERHSLLLLSPEDELTLAREGAKAMIKRQKRRLEREHRKLCKEAMLRRV